MLELLVNKMMLTIHVFVISNLITFVYISDADFEKLAQSKGKLAQYLSVILGIYFLYHLDAYGTQGLQRQTCAEKFGAHIDRIIIFVVMQEFTFMTQQLFLQLWIHHC